MPPTQNGRVIFKEVPTDFPIPGETIVYDTQSIDLDNAILNGGVLVKTLYLSVDPYFRGRMREPHIKSYLPAFPLGQPIFGFGVAQVLRSEKEGIKPRDILYVTEMPHQHYNVLSPEHPIMVIDEKKNIPLSSYVGVLGMPGKTAYYGLTMIGHPKNGETIYVSTGAGPVGATVAQLSKASGLKVIASAGSDEKVEYMRSIGVDVPFNYKKEKIGDVLAREGPIDIYWDNVGGESLEAAIDACNDDARIIACGAISAYNGGTPYGVKNFDQIFAKTLTIKGFLVGKLEPQADDPMEFYRRMTSLVELGRMKSNEHIYQGLESIGDVILAVQKGDNTAKAVVKVADL